MTVAPSRFKPINVCLTMSGYSRVMPRADARSAVPGSAVEFGGAMPTLAAIALAIVSLFIGALIEPPAARAAGKQKNAAKPLVQGEADIGFRVASEDISAGTSTRFVAIALPRRQVEAELTRIAEVARAAEKQPFEKTVVNFYLPGMRIGQGAWAVATFNPALKVSIVGLRLDEEQTAEAELKVDRRNLIGSWLMAPPATPGRLTIYKEGARSFAEWRLRDGTRSVEELSEQKDHRGRHMSPVAGGSMYYLLSDKGELELRDERSIIATGERLRVANDKAAEVAAGNAADKAGAKSQATKERVVPSRSRRAVPQATSSASAGAALSQQVFKF